MPRRIRREKSSYNSPKLDVRKLMKCLENDRRKRELEQQKNNLEDNNTKKDRN